MNNAMASRTRKTKRIRTPAGALVVVAVVTSSFFWRNTDVLGADSFCGARLDSGDVRAALDSTGRLSQVHVQGDSELAEFSCTVERTSRLPGGEDQRLTIRTGSEQGAFPFTTSVWKNPAARSYFKDGMTGAVSPTDGYVVLPESCWDKVGGIQGSRAVRSGEGAVATVEVTVEKGAVDRAGLARLLTHSARQIAEKAGCATPVGSGIPALGAPDESRMTDVRNACGLKGFSLPENAVLLGRAEPDREQVNDAISRTWACDMYLAGSAKANLSFTATTDDVIVDAALKGTERFRPLSDHEGVATTGAAVLHCRNNDVFFAARWSSEYDGALLESLNHSVAAYTDVRKTTFQNFLDAAAGTYSCPHAHLP